MLHTAAASALAVVLCTFIPVAAAQLPAPEGPGGLEGSRWGLGLGVMNTQKPYEGSKRESRALPFLQFENQYLKLSPMGFDVKLPRLSFGDKHRLDFAIAGRRSLDGAGYEADDAPILAGMAERKRGYSLGASVRWRNDFAHIRAEWTSDVSNTSNGQRVSLNLERPWRVGGNLMIMPRIGVARVDSNYVDYYFGVRSDEAVAGRPAYVGKSGVVPGAGVSAIYRFDAHHSMMFDARVVGLPKSIKDSPLVDASTENRVFMGYSYRF
jgi:outer membrane protein